MHKLFLLVLTAPLMALSCGGSFFDPSYMDRPRSPLAPLIRSGYLELEESAFFPGQGSASQHIRVASQAPEPDIQTPHGSPERKSSIRPSTPNKSFNRSGHTPNPTS